ncbi:protein of unknown function [Stenotrophomonas maltophilia]|nr:protein of unknown function [Stenotrophomonas maltophilia]
MFFGGLVAIVNLPKQKRHPDYNLTRQQNEIWIAILAPLLRGSGRSRPSSGYGVWVL